VNKKFIIFSVGILLEIIAAIMIIPAAIAFFEIPTKIFPDLFKDPALLGFLIAIFSSFSLGLLLKNIGSRELTGSGIREGFAIVTFAWALLTFFGSIPLWVYFLSQFSNLSLNIIAHTFTDAYFEIMSGFTTTGSTILTDIEIIPRGLLFWRSLTHWLGGMGIITLALAILPAFGVASYQMFRGEIPGPTTERLKPRLAQTAKILWGAYALLTLAETILLQFGGMPLFDALCHSFGTMATGGFSTKNASIAAYQSPYIHWVITAFMFFAGMNFIIHYRILFAKKLDFLKTNREFHFYTVILIGAILIGTLTLLGNNLGSKEQISRSFRNKPLSQEALSEKILEESSKISSPMSALQHASFQIVSITTTTGYCVSDFDTWPNFIRYMLVILMFFGGCAGSTGGGIKMIRMMVIIKAALREIKVLIQPRIIAPIKIARRIIEEKEVANIVGFVALFLTSFVVLSLVMSFMVEDFTTAFTSVAATMCNIGPGLSGVGASENYAWIPLPGKWILTLCMLLGRLEIYTVFIALAPISWKQ